MTNLLGGSLPDGDLELHGAEPLPELLPAAAPAERSPNWAGRYRAMLLASDVCALVLAVAAGIALRFGLADQDHNRVEYLLIGVAIIAGWTIALQHSGGYEVRHLATAPVEARRVLAAAGITVSFVAITSFVLKFPLARGFVVGVIPVGTALLLIGRSLVRHFVNRRRQRGAWTQRLLAVGTAESVEHLLEVTERARHSGLRIVGVCVEDRSVGFEMRPGVPVLGGVLDAARHAETIDADVVAVASSGLGPTGVRELGWQLERTGRGLVMAPALTQIAGTRIKVSPVEGLPLVWLEQPGLGRLRQVLKRSVDLIIATAMLVLGAPILLATAVAIKLTSRGPVFFRQARLGLNGTEFSILKFRSMFVGSEVRRAEILELNEQDGSGILFKIRADPRVTPVGQWLRKFSLDELPQLVHVLTGKMSLVGPRPLAVADSTYDGSARRRLLVRPGLTGLWQISGRSDLSWDDALRLDLYYVENWSIGLDLSILVRTILAVLGRDGAY